MPARQKLNSVFLCLCLVLGAMVALSSRSTDAFWVTTGLLVMIAIHSGAIRPNRGNKN